MSRVHYSDDSLTLHHGDSLTALSGMPDRSVDCCVTSPPYFGLRDYGTEPTDWPEAVFTPVAGLPPLTIPPMTASLGLEPDPWAYVGHMVLIFREVKRVLADDGTFWLNIGDSYASDPGNGRGSVQGRKHDVQSPTPTMNARKPGVMVSRKNLLGVPWRVALALQADGWILRNDVVWNKPNAMPESVTDRLSCRYEHVFLFSKRQRYWFDLDPIKVQTTMRAAGNTEKNRQVQAAAIGSEFSGGRRAGGNPGSTLLEVHETRNPGDVWSIPTQPFAGAHYAVMPTALAERCMQAGCKPGGVVLDPFSGSGTTGLAAARHGHPFVGVDLNAENLDLSLSTRLAQAGLPFGNLADSG